MDSACDFLICTQNLPKDVSEILLFQTMETKFETWKISKTSQGMHNKRTDSNPQTFPSSPSIGSDPFMLFHPF